MCGYKLPMSGQNLASKNLSIGQDIVKSFLEKVTFLTHPVYVVYVLYTSCLFVTTYMQYFTLKIHICHTVMDLLNFSHFFNNE